MKSRLTSAVINGAVVLVSLAVALVVCEGAARIVLDPGDYLSVTTVSDDVLGITLPPGSPGIDAWGFRNETVPAAADIVAVGDSHTFGNTARMHEAWPSVVAQRTGHTVYNLGLGGYGPNQYYQLLKTKGVTLKPKWVLCGLYFGDDFENAFSITYGLDHWASLRTERFDNVNADIWDNPVAPGRTKDLRAWLSANSLTYRLVVHGALFGSVKEAIRFRRVANKEDPETTMLVVEGQGIREAFRPIGIARRLDQRSREVREGMRVTKRLLGEMDRTCRDAGCRFAVVLIPTKETVFAPYLERESHLHLRDALAAVVVNEQAAGVEIKSFLDASGIAYVDTLPALRSAVDRHLYAPTTADMHPGAAGYGVIAEAVAAFLKERL
jgi:hypothetical protein